MNNLRGILDFCIRHQTALGYSTVSLLTVAMEQIFSSAVFKCPCNSWNTLYGSAFLLVPAIVLFLLGFMVNAKMWHLLTGICSSEKRNSQETCIHCCHNLVPVLARALVGPPTWIAVALLSVSFYECAASGSSRVQSFMCKDTDCYDLLAKIPCNPTLSKNITGDSLSFQAQSQLIGWLLILIITTVVLSSKCYSRCTSPVTYLQHKFCKIYSEQETKLFEVKAKEHATNLAEVNTRCFFEVTDPAPAPCMTPSNEDWKKTSLLYTYNPQEQYYSRLHKYASTNRGNSTTRFGEGGRIPPVSGSVDEAALRESGF
ncbi:calcium homeostasis modulator protein 6 [Calypte anna]|uniref:calcium homeostasis modulator protein 6 n=1 Tax=Calypte anna TaxID=9244 RepID=UPI0011C4214B|nr:calcium homeostasis modulator protein 6 [Calypte anna]XP_030303725.1 calcium homeostasis modulator protein 6 [Calypte anna]